MKMAKIVQVLSGLLIVFLLLAFGAAPALAGAIYRVKQGDTAQTVARENNISVKRLMASNPFMESPYVLHPGQVLVIPEVRPGEKYQVSAGETLESIAGEHGIEAKALAEYNDLGRKTVFPGQVIIIPPPPPGIKPLIKAAPAVPKTVAHGPGIPGLMREFPGLIAARGPGNKKEVALTFDDGPDNKYTPQIMDILDRNHIKATFFMVGSLVEKYPSVVKMLVEDGQQVAGHSWSHSNLAKMDRAEAGQELEQTAAAFRKVLGLEPLMYRPPYGTLSEDVMKDTSGLGYTAILWNADSLDWYSRAVDSILSSTLIDTKPGSIILMHSAGENLNATVEALPELIYTLKSQGYTFVTVSDLLGKSPYREQKKGRVTAIF